jgi:hypothetical protein
MVSGIGLMRDGIRLESDGAIVDFTFDISGWETTITLAGFAKRAKVALFV